MAYLSAKRRTSPRFAAAVDRALKLLSGHSPGLIHEAGFWFTPEQKNAAIVHDRSAAPASLRKLNMIFESEIRAAIAIARQEDPRPGDRDLPAAAASVESSNVPAWFGAALYVRSL
jgi:hypothetical protein